MRNNLVVRPIKFLTTRSSFCFLSCSTLKAICVLCLTDSWVSSLANMVRKRERERERVGYTIEVQRLCAYVVDLINSNAAFVYLFGFAFNALSNWALTNCKRLESFIESIMWNFGKIRLTIKFVIYLAKIFKRLKQGKNVLYA